MAKQGLDVWSRPSWSPALLPLHHPDSDYKDVITGTWHSHKEIFQQALSAHNPGIKQDCSAKLPNAKRCRTCLCLWCWTSVWFLLLNGNSQHRALWDKGHSSGIEHVLCLLKVLGSICARPTPIFFNGECAEKGHIHAYFRNVLIAAISSFPSACAQTDQS